jgi:uncharacterized protein (DUF1330 family)
MLAGRYNAGGITVPAYMVVIANISERERFLAAYAPAAAALVEKFGGRYVLRGRGGAVLEGPGHDGQSVIISEWADRTAALQFWNSPEYREVKKLREGIADCKVLLVDGNLLRLEDSAP